MPTEIKKLRRLGWLAAVLLTLRLVDLAIVVVSGIVAYWLRNGLESPPQPELFAIIFAAALSLVVMNLGQAYLTTNAENFWALTLRVVGHWLLVFLLLLAAAFAFKVTGDFSRLWAGAWLCLAAVGFVAARILMTIVVRRAQKAGRLSVRVAIIGADEGGLQLYHHLRSHGDHVEVVGVFDDRIVRLQKNANERGVTILGRVSDLLIWARSTPVDCVVITLPWSSERRLRELIEMLQVLDVEVQICPEGLGFVVRSFPLFRNSIATTLGGLPMFTVVRRPFDGLDWLVKGIEDGVLLALMLPVVLPVCLLIALAIKLDSPGPALFRQLRSGFNGRNFWVYKFRTMDSSSSEPDGVTNAARRNDPRVTRVGRFLRRTSLDELPQLLNVLKGEMSIIGPRPHAVYHDRQFARQVSQYYSRHRVRPGITGWAQVNGLRGSVEDEKHIRQRVDCDLWYIENWSILFDIRILLMTPFVGLINRNAY
ncbi:undecaprenyl-phosphate glucose phosphotransferase [Telmatospirillum siberiense]|uniref:Undecaprenyl-phosphate glucose phosphotransferase n=1 Tax=Telmatospirillum siberiense TaxID=382514 RepID=A0A2N3PVJ2_9PROT|nr:undecaprenyl-phosphate glucose phosphotransferase [Telmatospirillum siberiense]PKU24424.1 undecaprenyl-phosphate glucose phosphotransferase [Telmatospirillum siberiense]